MTETTTIGLDLAKSVFFLVKMDAKGQQLARKRLRRHQLSAYMQRLTPCCIAMEACGGAHHWARTFQTMGHEVRLLPAQHVKGYQRGQKNDYNDATAIAEACLHGAMRAVAIKSQAQQDQQSLHRLRRGVEQDRTRLINRLRGLLGEYGVVIGGGVAALRRALPELLEAEEARLSPWLRQLLGREYRRLQALDEELKGYDAELRQQAAEDPVCQSLQALPGFGPVVSSAVAAWLGDGQQFRRGRDASAALGVVPAQHTTGGKIQLLGITKRGDRYLRSLVIHGARAVVTHAGKKHDPLSRWLQRLIAERGFNKAVVALANKLVRIAWVIVARGERYRPEMAGGL